MSGENLQLELKTKRICRFCMTQTEPLTNIYSRENKIRSIAPLPLQIMSCMSIEVFTNDGMPSTICDHCRILMDHCYRFKQMCRKADNSLRQYPLTGVWPKQLEIPKLPEEFILKLYPNLNQKQKMIANTQTDKREQKSQMKVHNSQAPSLSSSAGTQSNSSTITIISSNLLQPSSSSVASTSQQQQQKPPRLLNKNSVKILNKDAQKNPEPILSQPIIKRDSAGNVEIITEIIEQDGREESQIDPIKNAAPVETNVFPCPHCERSFPLRQLLDIHMVNHSRERSFQCNTCTKSFFSKYDLGKHMLIHTGEKPYECVVCKKAFTRSTLLHRHEKIHTDQPKYLCVYCEKPFLSKEEMDKHTERHKKNRPFVCKICNKAFAFKQGLERHETIHAKDQPYPCQYCDYSFSTPSKLARHLTAHAGDRPFPCKLCPKSYLLSHHLTRHLRSHKQSQGIYKCCDCEKVFSTRDDLIYHSAVHATQTLVCPLCKEHFDDIDHVTEHIKNHAEGEQFACEFCDLIFMTAEKLQSHCGNEHSEDLAAYQEHDNKNAASKLIKNEKMNLNYTDDSQESLVNNNEEVIEEFIIEEYEHNEDVEEMQPQIIEEPIIKNEDDIILGKDIVFTSRQSKNNDIKNLNQQQPHEIETVICGNNSSGNQIKASIFIEEDIEESELMENFDFIETFPKEGETEEYIIDDKESIIDDDPPAAKYIKLSSKERQTRIKPESSIIKKSAVKESVLQLSKLIRKSATDSKIQKSKIKIEKDPNDDTTKTSGKSKQSPEINNVLKQLPKSLIVTKSQNTEKSDESVKLPSPSETKTQKPTSRILNAIKTSPPLKSSTKGELKKSNTTQAKNTTHESIATRQQNEMPKIKVEKDKNYTKTTVQTVTSKNSNNREKRLSGGSNGNNSINHELSPDSKTKNTSNSTSPQEQKKELIEMMIDNRKVKVQKILMTKSQVELMAKEGKIEMKDGTMILKNINKKLSSLSNNININKSSACSGRISPNPNKEGNKSKMMTRSKQQQQQEQQKSK